jgi:hypothetical protein
MWGTSEMETFYSIKMGHNFLSFPSLEQPIPFSTGNHLVWLGKDLMTAEVPKIEIESNEEQVGLNKEDQLSWRQDRDVFMKDMKALQESSRTHGKDALLRNHMYLHKLTVDLRGNTQASTALHEPEEGRQDVNGLPLQS